MRRRARNRRFPFFGGRLMFVAGGIDIGGTFTDCVLLDRDGQVYAGKASTTREDLLKGFFNSIDAAAVAAGRTGADAIRELRDLAHGTTVATNIMVQNAGARVGLLTTRGHADAVTIQRSAGRIVGVPTSEILDLLAADKPHPLVDAACIEEIDERVDVDGEIIAPLDPAQVQAAVATLVAQGVESVAVAYLWSFRNARHEEETRDLIAGAHPGLFVSISHEVAPSWGEYERSMTAVINSYVGIETGEYLGRMSHELSDRGYTGSVAIMESTGGVADPVSAARFPVRLILSGPAGALVASADLAAELDLPNVITSDMGGTSFDVGLVIGGSIVRTDRTTVGRYEIQLPSVDVRSIGN
jgi:N-methylhydantoinase A